MNGPRSRGILSHSTLLWVWTLREIRVRYKQSLLGVLWAVLQPLSMMVVLSVVFSVFARLPTDGYPYPVFSLTALIPWMFLANAMTGAVTSLTNNMTLIQKIYFPREILPLATVLASLFDLLVASVVLVPLFLFYSIPLRPSLFWLPLVLLVQLVFVVGFTLPVAALCVRFRDVRFLAPLLLQIWLFASPVIYPTSLVPERFRWLYFLNPMAGLLETYRTVALRGLSPPPAAFLTSTIIAVGTLILGYAYFRRREPEFADII